jgi:hypothetical protein
LFYPKSKLIQRTKAKEPKKVPEKIVKQAFVTNTAMVMVLPRCPWTLLMAKPAIFESRVEN